MSRTLVLLTLNEIEGCKALYSRIPFSAAEECLVVDGGSRDGTVEFFQERGIKVVPQEKKGRGEAFRIAVERATGENIVFFSPDGNEDSNDIPKLFSLLEEGYDMAIASRFMNGARNEEDDLYLPWRAWANRSFTFLANTLWGGSISDTINGYRGIKKSAFKKINADAEGFAIEYQMSIRAMKLGLRVAEIPTIEGHRIGGESTAQSIPTGLRFLRFLIKEICVGEKFLVNK